MKKLLLITILFVSGIAIAQNEEVKKEKMKIEKGTWNFGGLVSLNYSDNEAIGNNFADGSSQFAFSFVPDIGYSIDENLILGLGIGYEYRNNENDNSNNESSLNAFIISPYVQKYFAINDKFLFTLKGELSYTKILDDNNFSNSSSERDTDSFFAGIRPGISFFVSDQIALEATFGSLGYSRGTSENSQNSIENTSNNFGFNLNSSSLAFGFTYFLR